MRRFAPFIVTLILAAPVALSQSEQKQTISNLELPNRDIRDILQIFAHELEVTILADSTVSGSTSYFVRSEMEVERAFQVFLDSNKLYVAKNEDVYTVSRIGVAYHEEALTVDAESMSLPLILDRISEAIGKTIVYAGIPDSGTTIHARSLPVERVIEILIAGLDRYKLELNDDFYKIAQSVQTAPAVTPTRPSTETEQPPLISAIDDRYTVNVDRATLAETLNELFEAAGEEYSLFAPGESAIRDLRLSDLTFESALRFILDQGKADFVRIGDVHVIFTTQERDILKKYKSTVRIPLSSIAVSELPTLLPADLASAGFYKLDRSTNSVILRGSMEEIGPLQEFIEFVDAAAASRRIERFDLSHIDVSQVTEVLPARFQRTDLKIIPNTNSFIVSLTEEESVALRELIGIIDVEARPQPIVLQYLRSDELMNHLPPSVQEENIVATSDPSLIFFVGQEKELVRFREELEIIDNPVPQIRYDLLVIQYQQGENASWNYSFDSSLKTADSATAFLGTIGQLLNLNFNVLSNFGYLFALKLNADIGNNGATILADSTLNGLSGQKLKFQNTNTYRYRDMEIDPDTGSATSTGVTREITSGLIIEVEGWVSGDEMITMDISATISKRGADVSLSSGNPPPTSEKIVETHVRTPSGEPIVISGLIQRDTDLRVKGIPLLMDIPGIGQIFTQQTKSIENTELAVYIVPHVLHLPEPDFTLDQRFEAWFSKFLGSAVNAAP